MKRYFTKGILSDLKNGWRLYDREWDYVEENLKGVKD